MSHSRAASCCCSPPVLPLLESRHLGFVHIPKNAGTSVEHALGLPRSCHATAAECQQSPPPPPWVASPPPPPKRRRCVKPGFMWQRDGSAWKCARYTADVAATVKREKRREHRQHRANRQRQRKRDERKRQRVADAEASADIAALGEDFGIF